MPVASVQILWAETMRCLKARGEQSKLLSLVACRVQLSRNKTIEIVLWIQHNCIKSKVHSQLKDHGLFVRVLTQPSVYVYNAYCQTPL